SKAVYIATAVDNENKRDILGLRVDHVESKAAWERFFQSLKSRGLQSPKLIISDAHKGLKAAIESEFVGSSWQRCTVHFKRNLFKHLPKKGVDEVKMGLKRIFEVSSVDDARKYKQEFIDTFCSNLKLEKV